MAHLWIYTHMTDSFNTFDKNILENQNDQLDTIINENNFKNTQQEWEKQLFISEI